MVDRRRPEGIGKGLKVLGLLLLLLVPLLTTAFPPATDLPQHLAQIHLLREATKSDPNPYRVNWLAPNNLVYYLLYGIELFLPPLPAGRFLLIIIVSFWVLTICRLSDRIHSSLLPAMLACLLVFNLSFYWGFLNFLMGFPFFLILISQVTPVWNRRRWALMAILFIGLYTGHVLWFLLGAAFWSGYSLLRSAGLRSFLYRVSAFFPALVVAAAWYPSLLDARRSAGFDLAARWFTPPLQRLLKPGYLVDSGLGGVRGGLEPAVMAGVGLWIMLALLTRRRGEWHHLHWPLFAGFAICFLLTLLGPEKYLNTIYFAQRWFPGGLVMLLLFLPLPRIPPRLLTVGAGAVVILFVGITTLNWVAFNQQELTGLERALAKMPPGQRVMGLDFIKESRFIKGRPFLQIPAYAQVLKGADINFSFAEHGSGLVRYRVPRMVWWTPGLEWFAERVKPADFGHFDWILINHTEKGHRRFGGIRRLAPVTATVPWRLYRVRQADPPASFPDGAQPVRDGG